MSTSSSASFPMEFTAASGDHVIILDWPSVLHGINFPLDGTGCLRLLPPCDGIEESMVLVALPESAGSVNVKDELWFELAFAGGANTTLMALVIVFRPRNAVLKGVRPEGVGLFASLDLAAPPVRDTIAKLAAQSSVLLLVVHPRTGELLLEIRHAHVELRERMRKALAGSVGARAMSRAETSRAHAELSDMLSS